MKPMFAAAMFLLTNDCNHQKAPERIVREGALDIEIYEDEKRGTVCYLYPTHGISCMRLEKSTCGK